MSFVTLAPGLAMAPCDTHPERALAVRRRAR